MFYTVQKWRRNCPGNMSGRKCLRIPCIWSPVFATMFSATAIILGNGCSDRYETFTRDRSGNGRGSQYVLNLSHGNTVQGAKFAATSWYQLLMTSLTVVLFRVYQITFP